MKKNTKEKKLKGIKNNNVDFMTIGILIFSILVLGAGIVIVIKGNNENNNYFDTLGLITTFFSTIIFSWILSRLSSEREFKCRQKESASKAYRHIKQIGAFTKATKEGIDNLIKKYSKNEAIVAELGGINCSLNAILGGVQTSIQDWADILYEELQDINEYNDILQELTKVKYEKMLLEEEVRKRDAKDEDLKDKTTIIEELNGRIHNLEEKLKSKKYEINDNPLYVTTVEIEPSKNKGDALNNIADILLNFSSKLGANLTSITFDETKETVDESNIEE